MWNPWQLFVERLMLSVLDLGTALVNAFVVKVEILLD
jgi:hypothetical protein